MDNSDNQSHDDNRLRKDEILRGRNAYSRVLQNSISVSTEFLKAFVNLEGENKSSIDFTSPLFTKIVKVGFIIAKKRIKKSVLRNRIKRLLRESYRLNKKNYNTLCSNLNIIFSLTERGTDYFMNNPKTKITFVREEMDKLQSKIKKHFNC